MRFGSWAREIGGPLTLTAGDGVTHLALFEDTKRAGKATTVALRVDAASFVSFHKRAAQLPLFDKRRRPSPPHLQDHALSLSLYFNDRDGNPIELTTYEVIRASPRITGSDHGTQHQDRRDARPRHGRSAVSSSG